MFTGSGGAGGHWEERPSRGKKIPVKISTKRFVIYHILFIMLFILMLVILYVVEMAGRAQAQSTAVPTFTLDTTAQPPTTIPPTDAPSDFEAKLQDAEDFCITGGLNRTDAQLDSCIQNILGLSAFFEAGGTAEELMESLMAQMPAYATEVSQRSATEISQSYATQTAISQSPLRATETMQSLITQSSSLSATQLSQIRQRATEASQG